MAAYFASLYLIHEAPHPRFARFNRAHQRMFGVMKVLGSVLVLGGIAAAHIATFHTQPQMHPRIAGFYALLTNALVGACNCDLIQMRALCHRAPRFSVCQNFSQMIEHLMTFAFRPMRVSSTRPVFNKHTLDYAQRPPSRFWGSEKSPDQR